MNRELIFGDNFKRFRKRKGISQKEFARLLFDATGKRLTLTSVSNYETGLHLPPPQVLPSIAEILEVSIDALFGKNPATGFFSGDTADYAEETEEAVTAEPAGPDIVKEWKHELESLEREFVYWKGSRANELSKESAAKVAVEFADKITELAKKQQEELVILQTELATIREVLSFFRK